MSAKTDKDELIEELKMSLVTGCVIRKRFRMMLWKIVTGKEWPRQELNRKTCSRCIRCGHYAPTAFGIGCELKLDPDTCNDWRKA